MASARRRVKGDRAFRKLLRRLPDSFRDGMVELLDDVGTDLVNAIRPDVPSRTGELRAGISKKVLRGVLRLKVGIIGKANARRLFRGRILDLGRKAQTVTVRRRSSGAISRFGRRLSRGKKVQADVVSTYQLRVRAYRGRRFVTGKRPALMASINRRINAFWNKSLAKAAAGVTDA